MKKQIFPWLVAIFASMVSTAILTACSKDDEDDLATIPQSDIIGTWNSEDSHYKNDRFEFFDDGTAVRKYSDTSKLYSDNYKWEFAINCLTLTDDSDMISNHTVNRDGSLLSFELDGITYSKTSLSSSGVEPPVTSFSDKKIIGEWWCRISSYKTKIRYFCSNGKGYEKYIYDDEDYGLAYYGFVWSTPEEGKMTIHYDDESNSREYEYAVTGKECTFKIGSNEETWAKISDNVDESFDPSLKPFANCYLLNRITGYYYQITKMVSGCNHAGAGDNMNEKFLHFFGSDGLLTTTGLRIVYYTPRWEGIDSYWASGNYNMSLFAGAYKYASMAWCNGNSLDTYDGTLKISRSGKITTYDYIDEDVELHVLVKAN